MKINECLSSPLSETGSLFTELSILDEEQKIFISADICQLLDLEYFYNHSGNKNTTPLADSMYEFCEHDTYQTTSALASVVYNHYHSKWEKITSALNTEYNALNNYDMTEISTDTTESENNENNTVTNDGTSTVNGSNAITTSNKTYGYDSVTAVPKDDTESNNSNESTGTNHNSNIEDKDYTGSSTTQHTLSRSGNIGVTTSQQMLESELKLRAYDIYATFFSDVDNLLALQIY